MSHLTGAGVVLALAACSRLPTIKADMVPLPSPPPVLWSADGALSDDQSAAILARLGGNGRHSGFFARHLALEESVVASPLLTDNEVRLLQDGPETYEAMLSAIREARDHINMETYILDDDVVGRRFSDALMERQAHGVQINLIRDSVGTLNTPAEYFQKMINAGVKVLEFNPINPVVSKRTWQLNRRDHRKLLIVDGEIAILGGINISNVYSSGSFRKRARTRVRIDPEATPAWRDTDLRIQGPVVAELQKLFIENWEGQQGIALPARQYFPKMASAGEEVVRAVGSSPDAPNSSIYSTLLSAIRSAEGSIRLTNAYFVPDPQLLASMEAAVRRGLEVTLILPSQTDSWMVFHAGRRHYTRLLRAGVRIFERRGVILHSKTALVDGVWSMVGSANLDWRSFLHNYELNVVVLGTRFGDQIQAMFAEDLAESEEILLSEWERRPFSTRLKEAIASMWAYWL